MKTLIYWTWIFGFTILNHLSKNNENLDFYINGRDFKVRAYLKENKKHPIFFPDIKLPDNAIVIDDLEKILPKIDMLIISIPSEFVVWFLESIKDCLKQWVIILNLSKWINNSSIKTIWDCLNEKLKWNKFHYSVLSGWMIASELANWNYMWADLAVEDINVWNKISYIFSKENLDIKIVLGNTRAVELYWAFKNIVAICIWYYEAKWYEASTLWYFLCKFCDELNLLMNHFWADDLEFSNYSFWWDLIATCFWASRNRAFWKLLWEWKTTKEVLNIFEKQNKISEWYKTFLWVYKIIKGNNNFIEINKLWYKIFDLNNIEN